MMLINRKKIEVAGWEKKKDCSGGETCAMFFFVNRVGGWSGKASFGDKQILAASKFRQPYDKSPLI